MRRIRIHDKEFEPYLAPEQVQQRVEELAAQLDRDLQGRRPLFIAVLNGAFMFAADLFRRLTIEAEISFIRLSSYEGTRSTGRVVTAIGLDRELRDRTVVILEDIVDTGGTLHAFLPQVRRQQPRQLQIAALLSKPASLRYSLPIDYCGFAVRDEFLLGYGLDYDGLGRNLPGIYRMCAD